MSSVYLQLKPLRSPPREVFTKENRLITCHNGKYVLSIFPTNFSLHINYSHRHDRRMWSPIMSGTCVYQVRQKLFLIYCTRTFSEAFSIVSMQRIATCVKNVQIQDWIAPCRCDCRRQRRRRKARKNVNEFAKWAGLDNGRRRRRRRTANSWKAINARWSWEGNISCRDLTEREGERERERRLCGKSCLVLRRGDGALLL